MRINQQSGATLIEVLVAVLILSFGLLSMGSMLATATQLPRLAANRATAINIANNYIDRMRTNPTGFAAGSYDESTPSFTGNYSYTSLSDCSYPACTSTSLATMDKAFIKRALKQRLPAGELYLSRDSATTAPNTGNLWIMWKEPSSMSEITGTVDSCPSGVSGNPRCIYIRFSL
jgi:type IV pilus assembly protein PilV